MSFLALIFNFLFGWLLGGNDDDLADEQEDDFEEGGKEWPG